MIAEIEIPWESSLLVNQAYVNGDMKLGHTKQCQKAMWDIVVLMRPAVGYGWEWNRERIQVVITAYRPSVRVDAQNLIKVVSDAVEEAIRVNDREFDVAAIGKLDTKNPRIRITLTQEDKDVETTEG